MLADVHQRETDVVEAFGRAATLRREPVERPRSRLTVITSLNLRNLAGLEAESGPSVRTRPDRGDGTAGQTLDVSPVTVPLAPRNCRLALECPLIARPSSLVA